MELSHLFADGVIERELPPFGRVRVRAMRVDHLAAIMGEDTPAGQRARVIALGPEIIADTLIDENGNPVIAPELRAKLQRPRPEHLQALVRLAIEASGLEPDAPDGPVAAAKND